MKESLTRKCKVCGVAMLNQPAAMTLENGYPEYFCDEHAPKLYEKIFNPLSTKD
jgi:hypothetical protein